MKNLINLDGELSRVSCAKPIYLIFEKRQKNRSGISIQAHLERLVSKRQNAYPALNETSNKGEITMPLPMTPTIAVFERSPRWRQGTGA